MSSMLGGRCTWASGCCQRHPSVCKQHQRRMLPSDAEDKILHAPMQAFNSPWGRYARHVWGGEGAYLRTTVFDDELRVQGIWSAVQQQALVDEARVGGGGKTC